ncbi:MAG TPA: AgmX/PglI C-terminal domain-containing protein [Enhygromyxa sp.]|nr:AgmX/PglI C-terminal domain-containing protein [Enhygromyxa sp.]
MRTISASFLIACIGCRAAAPVEPEPVDDRPWCEQDGHEWATPAAHESIAEPEPTPATALLGFASIDREMIRRPIREHMWAIEECYAMALVYDPHVIGRLSVRFVIELDGRVSEIEVVDDTLRDPCVGRCVIAAGKQHWSWPPRQAGGQITIHYPFLFDPATQ